MKQYLTLKESWWWIYLMDVPMSNMIITLKRLSYPFFNNANSYVRFETFLIWRWFQKLNGKVRQSSNKGKFKIGIASGPWGKELMDKELGYWIVGSDKVVEVLLVVTNKIKFKMCWCFFLVLINFNQILMYENEITLN